MKPRHPNQFPPGIGPFVGQVIRIALGVFVGIMLAFIVILIWNRNHPSVYVPVNTTIKTAEGSSYSGNPFQIAKESGEIGSSEEEVELPNGEIVRGENAHVPPVLQEEREEEERSEELEEARTEEGIPARE